MSSSSPATRRAPPSPRTSPPPSSFSRPFFPLTGNSAVGPGQVWIIYPFRKDADGNQGVAELLFELGDKAKESSAIYSDISDDGKFAYFTITLGNHVAALDISDLDNVKRLDDPEEDQPIIGPHYVKISPDKKNLLVTGYFVQGGDVSPLSLLPIFSALLLVFSRRNGELSLLLREEIGKKTVLGRIPADSPRSPSSTPPATTRATGSTSSTTAPSASTAPSTSRTSSPTAAAAP